MKTAASSLLLALSLAAPACTANTNHSREKAEMFENEHVIRRAAAAEKNWSEGDVVVAPLSGIELPPCRFYTATHRTRPIHEAATFALLPSGDVAGQSDETAIEKILAACDAGAASAATWAELLARFHFGVAPGHVLHEPEPPIAEGEAQKPFAPPRFVEEGGERIVRFYTRNRETMKRYEVSASITGGKVSGVSKKAAG